MATDDTAAGRDLHELLASVQRCAGGPGPGPAPDSDSGGASGRESGRDSAGNLTGGSAGNPADRPDVAGPATPDELLEALQALHRLRASLSAWEPLLIEEARRAGVAWARLAPALGVTSRQAAERRYLRLRTPTDVDLTAEQRVRAARDERAGERAVAGWARQNASRLRQVAGRASALTDLSDRGRRQAEALEETLDHDDPAALLEPLRAMHPHLVDDHEVLAAEVDDISRRIGRVRSETQRSRRRRPGPA